MCIRKKHKSCITATPKLQVTTAPRSSKPKPTIASFVKKPPVKSLPPKTFQKPARTALQKSTKGLGSSKPKSQSIKVMKDEGLPEIIKAKKPVNKQNSAGVLDLQNTPKKGRHVDQKQPKKQSGAILQKQSIENIQLISGAPRSMESWTKSCLATRQNAFFDEGTKRTEKSEDTPAVRSPQAELENCKDNNTRSPRPVTNVITSLNTKLHLDIEKPDPRYSQQQLIYSTFVRQGCFTRSWTFTDIRSEVDLVEQDFLEINAGFSNLIVGCLKADCPLKKAGSLAWAKNYANIGCCEQQLPVISSKKGIVRSPQSRPRF